MIGYAIAFGLGLFARHAIDPRWDSFHAARHKRLQRLRTARGTAAGDSEKIDAEIADLLADPALVFDPSVEIAGVDTTDVEEALRRAGVLK